MKLLLDTQILIGLSTLTLRESYPRIADAVAHGGHDLYASVASLWEIAIKSRLGKLDPGMRVASLPAFYESGGIVILPIVAEHALLELAPQPDTRDPFDRLLLAQCKIEHCRLLTVDRALVGHPLSAKLT